MGLVEGPFMPVSHSLMARESALGKRGHNMGVLQNFGSNLLGSFAAPLVLVAVAERWNWRGAFFLAGVPGLVMALLIARYVREPPRSTEPRARAGGIDAAGYLNLLRHRNMILCVLMSIFMVSWMVLGWVFLPVFYTKARQLSGGQMGVLMSLLGLSAAFFSFIVPGLSDRLGRRPVVVAANLIGLLVPFAVLYFHGSLYVLGVLVFVGWAASGTFPLFMATIPSETIPARYVATAVGLSVGVGEILGGVSAPALAGSAADRYGLTAPLFIQAGCALIGALLALGLKETAPGRVTAPVTTSPLAT
jgi:predicted MFS family arabinose efflux permease